MSLALSVHACSTCDGDSGRSSADLTNQCSCRAGFGHFGSAMAAFLDAMDDVPPEETSTHSCNALPMRERGVRGRGSVCNDFLCVPKHPVFGQCPFLFELKCSH